MKVTQTKNKVSVAVVFGGQSMEHDVSIESAKAVIRNIDREKYSPIPLYINKEGQWAFIEQETLEKTPPYQGTGIKTVDNGNFLSLSPWLIEQSPPQSIDIFFPVLHGPNGEDGKIQALWELTGTPYVGANSFASALAMDKGAAKTMFQAAGIKTPAFIIITAEDYNKSQIQEQVSRGLTYPLFVKPCRLGSSVGISKVNSARELTGAIDEAFKHDRRIIIEQGINAREIEISVMGNRELMVSPPGELVPGNEFYDYSDKYLDNQTQFTIPVKLPGQTGERIQELAKKAFRSLYLNGMSRIDFFLEEKTGEIYLNEINTIPGFTEISMFSKLWQVMGISFTDLISRLIEYGFQYTQQIKP